MRSTGVSHTLQNQFSPRLVVEQRSAFDADLIAAPLDAEDLARALTSFRGQPTHETPLLGYGRLESDGNRSAYVLDEASGMVYIVT